MSIFYDYWAHTKEQILPILSKEAQHRLSHAYEDMGKVGLPVIKSQPIRDSSKAWFDWKL